PHLDAARNQVKGALFRVAFLEQGPPGGQLANVGLAGEGVQILGLQAVQRRESAEHCEVERSFVHRNSSAPMKNSTRNLAANPTICEGSTGPRGRGGFKGLAAASPGPAESARRSAQ